MKYINWGLLQTYSTIIRPKTGGPDRPKPSGAASRRVDQETTWHNLARASAREFGGGTDSRYRRTVTEIERERRASMIVRWCACGYTIRTISI